MPPSRLPNGRNFASIFLCPFLVVTVSSPIDLFSRLYPLLSLTLSRVTRPLHQHLRPFTTNGALLPRDGGHFIIVSPVGGLGWFAPGLPTTGLVLHKMQKRKTADFRVKSHFP